MLLVYVNLPAERDVAPNIAARVGEQTITTEQLSDELARVSQREENAHLSYLQRRELALQRLVREELLYNYALEQDISVTADELDDYFRSIYGDHDRVTTDGEFDERKYQELKRRPEIRRLLNNLRRDLMINKAEAIIRNRFHYSESELIDRFFLENTELDLSYVLMDKEDISIPFLINPLEAYDFYEINSDKYELVKELSLSFFVVPFESKREKAAATEITEDQINEYIEKADISLINQLLIESGTSLPLDSVSTDISGDIDLRSFLLDQDSLKVYGSVSKRIIEERIEQFTYMEAQNSVSRMKSRLSVDYEIISLTIIDSPYDELNPPLFRKDSFLPQLNQLNIGEYSRPLKTEYGYMVIRLDDIIRERRQFPTNLARQLWRDFINYERIRREETRLQDLYAANISRYSVPAVYVTRIIADKQKILNEAVNDDKLYRFYQQRRSSIEVDSNALVFENLLPKIEELYLEEQLQELSTLLEEDFNTISRKLINVESLEYMAGVEAANHLIYLETLPNQDRFNELIKDSIGSLPQPGIQSLNKDDYYVFYVVNSWYPDYLEGYEQLQDYLYRQWTEEVDTGEEDYLEYYEAHRRHFVSADSLKLAGLFFPWEGFMESISEEDLRNHYEERKEHLYTEQQTIIEYIKISDPGIEKRGLVKKVEGWMNQGIEIPLLQSVIGSESDILSSAQDYTKRYSIDIKPADGQLVIVANSLPEIIAETIDKLSLLETSSPFYYNDSWYFLRKVREIESERASYLDMRWFLREELMRERAENEAHRLAVEAFGEFTSVRSLDHYPDSVYVFTTEKKPVSSEFGPLGDITGYQPRLLSLRRNERLNTIFTNENGFGIVFCLEKTLGEPMEFEEAFDTVRETFHADLRTENALNYARYLRDLVISGLDPHKLLVFWGGWHTEEDLTFNQLIPGVEYSRQIIQSAAEGNEGQVSHIIRNKEGEYLFYRLDRKEGVSMECYHRERDEYRDSVFRADFERWLNDYGYKIGIEKF